MKLNDLKSGMVCKLRNGNLYFVLKDTVFGDVLVNVDSVEKNTGVKKSAIQLSRYSVNMRCVGNAPCNIDEVFAPVGQMCLLRSLDARRAKSLYVSVWKRDTKPQKNEVRKMTMDELKSLLGHDVIITE